MSIQIPTNKDGIPFKSDFNFSSKKSNSLSDFESKTILVSNHCFKKILNDEDCYLFEKNIKERLVKLEDYNKLSNEKPIVMLQVNGSINYPKRKKATLAKGKHTLTHYELTFEGNLKNNSLIEKEVIKNLIKYPNIYFVFLSENYLVTENFTGWINLNTNTIYSYKEVEKLPKVHPNFLKEIL